MRNYWNESKFADWLRGAKKPPYASSENWDKWEEEIKKLHPIRFWLAENGLEILQNIVTKPIDFLYKIKYYVINRYVTKTHSLTSTLKRGEYNELDTRILYCLFDELVNFVEIEKAWMQVVFNDDDNDDFKQPWYASGWFRTRTWRHAEMGLKYLAWEQTLTHSDGTMSEQARTAKEVQYLYTWWLHERPNRPDPMDHTGWTKYCDDKRIGEARSLEEEAEAEKMLYMMNDIEDEYDREDEEMLIRLIKIRKSLWT